MDLVVYLLSLIAFANECETSRQKVFYVSLSEYNPLSSVLTFADLSSNISQYILPMDRVTLIFETGIHYLESDMSILNINEIVMLSNGTFSTITCNDSSKLRFKMIGHIQINSFEFIGCSNRFEGVNQLFIENSSFTGTGNSDEAALELIESSVNITLSNFTNHHGSSTGHVQILDYLKTEQNIETTTDVRCGGAVIATQSNVTITYSVLERNSAEIGGAMFANKGSKITIFASVFDNNWAACIKKSVPCLSFGGAVHVDNNLSLSLNNNAALLKTEVIVMESNFSNNTAAYGGVITAYNSTIMVNNCGFHNSLAESGGVIWAQTRSSVYINNCKFSANIAHSFGGGVIAAIESTTVFISDSEYIDNKASRVGGVLIICKSIVRVNNTSFTKNMGDPQIGYRQTTALAHTNLTSDICKKGFHLNRHVKFAAYTYGGVLATIASSVFINNSQLEDNRAIFGGALKLFPNSTLSVWKTEFTRNRAQQGGALYSMEAEVFLTDNRYSYNTAHFYLGNGGAISLIDSIAVVHLSQFDNNKVNDGSGGVLHLIKQASLYIYFCNFSGNSATDEGGAISSLGSYISINNGNFTGNTASNGGSVYISGSNLTIRQSHFIDNSANLGGGLYVQWTTARVTDSDFVRNTARSFGGAIHTPFEYTSMIIERCQFKKNVANFGAVIDADGKTSLFISNCSFIKNTAYFGLGIISAIDAVTLQISDSCIANNYVTTNGVVYLAGSNVHFAGHMEFVGNSGPVYAYNSKVNFTGKTIFDNVIASKGSAISAFQSIIMFYGDCHMGNSIAMNGGILQAIGSKVEIYGETVVTNNTAFKTGGGIYLYQSELSCQGKLTIQNNTAYLKGGGIHAISSTIKLFSGCGFVNSSMTFKHNYAKNAGGGIYLEFSSKIYIIHNGRKMVCTVSDYSLHFLGNSAELGGALYIADNTNFGTCVSSDFESSECFLQILTAREESVEKTTSIKFTQNVAQKSGSAIFGGLLDRCTVSRLAEIRYSGEYSYNDVISGIRYVTSITNINLAEFGAISSFSVQVCFCKNHKPDCSFQPPTMHVMKGKIFKLDLVAVDQMNHTVNSTVIHSKSESFESGLGEGQQTQKTEDLCTELNFSIYSPHPSEQLSLYAKGPCKDANVSQTLKQIEVEFLPCSCPVGFQPNLDEKTSCMCDCDSQLSEFITNCDPKTNSVIREGNFWITFINHSNGSSGYLVNRFCPLDYCLPPQLRVSVNLDIPGGADVQCAHNRSGILCAACQPGLSLSLGSSRCVPCSTSWRIQFVATLLAIMCAGIFLVVFLLVLNLTVATGTINGLIFYANIVGANDKALLHFTKPNFVTIFLSWLNLELGFDTCFLEGMDTYCKTWLQILFSTYVILLVTIVIFVSERSTRFARLLGKKNPVATLATLLLLSYVKLLKVIITSFSFTHLDYPGPDTLHKTVWLPDGRISYFSGKHIALFLVALGILLLGIIFTVLIFSWQWLLYHQNKRILKWVTKQQKLCHFIEPYHAPYSFKYRYWTGLLLYIRIVLYAVFALNASNDPGVNLLAVGIVMFSLFFIKGLFVQKLYKKWILDVLEMAFYLNAALISVASLYSQDKTVNGANVIAYISGSVSFVLFFLVLSYHILTETCISCVKKFNPKIWKRTYKGANDIEFPLVNRSMSGDHHNEPKITKTIVEAPSHGEQPLSALDLVEPLLTNIETHT